MRIFFSAGEPSGDLHGANLIRELRRRDPDIECIGFGGPQMAAAGGVLLEDLTQFAVMWFARALANLHVFWNLAGRADRCFAHQRPDAVVLIDYPGFNWWIARRAKAHGIPVFYYAPPQLWAWAGWRVRKMRRLVDHVMCALPFEQAWFSERGCRATFVGHPYFDEVRRQQFDQEFLDRQQARPGRLVTILPGSRTQEVTHNLYWLLKAAKLIRDEVGDVRFAVASFKPQQAQMAQEMLRDPSLQLGTTPIEIHIGRTPELIHLAESCLAVSGSVSLELLYQQKPSVISYHVSPAAFAVQKRFRKVRYITLVNLLSAADLFPAETTPYDPDGPGNELVLFPEYLTCEDKSAAMARQVVGWLTDDVRREALVARLGTLKQTVGHGGASKRAVDLILGELAQRPRPIPRPHFSPQAGYAARSHSPAAPQ
ncbi:MAG: lipid-A-disaccharide synthase [Planctomycetia bacterium]|nr:lipid-A-disaccharide synthase [Planctomycetia bacterium]